MCVSYRLYEIESTSNANEANSSQSGTDVAESVSKLVECVEGKTKVVFQGADGK
jgi:hypothetical protein